MKPLTERAVRIDTEMPVHIPTLDGQAIAETILIKVPALRDLETGEITLTGEALQMLDKVKARLMGVLLPSEIKSLRGQFDFTQTEMSDLLGIGEKTYTRWETGRERPSQSLNRLLVALWEGRLNPASLRAMRQPTFPWYERITGDCPCGSEHKPTPIAANAEMEEGVPNEICGAAA
jgi:DNA-binding transcriptional regulator YiaG